MRSAAAFGSVRMGPSGVLEVPVNPADVKEREARSRSSVRYPKGIGPNGRNARAHPRGPNIHTPDFVDNWRRVKLLQYNTDGAWRSPVACLLWEQEVAGSNPAAPTGLSSMKGTLACGRSFLSSRYEPLRRQL